MSIVELVEERAREEEGSKVTSVELEIGASAGIIREALEFAWEPATSKTMLENAKLKINWVPTEAQCESCGHIFSPESAFEPCPQCGSFQHKILKGKELRVVSFFVE
jgi:hydrogenase nickel incorporation protein HypA/HybF